MMMKEEGIAKRCEVWELLIPYSENSTYFSNSNSILPDSHNDYTGNGNGRLAGDECTDLFIPSARVPLFPIANCSQGI